MGGVGSDGGGGGWGGVGWRPLQYSREEEDSPVRIDRLADRSDLPNPDCQDLIVDLMNRDEIMST